MDPDPAANYESNPDPTADLDYRSWSDWWPWLGILIQLLTLIGILIRLVTLIWDPDPTADLVRDPNPAANHESDPDPIADLDPELPILIGILLT